MPNVLRWENINYKNSYVVFVLVKGFGNRIPVYGFVGSNITLPCSVDNISSAVWDGPCLQSCTYRLFLRYFDGLKKNPNLSTQIRINSFTKVKNRISHYDLQIFNASIQNEGVYQCYGIGNGLKNYQTYRIVTNGKCLIMRLTLTTIFKRCSQSCQK